MPSNSVFRRNSPFFQNLVMGCILFCLPGIYAALTGLGAGGGRPSSSSVANKTNAILYGLFALCGWLGGTVVNMLKPRLSAIIGSFGYPLYIAGLWYFDRTGNSWFPLWSGAMLGMLCGILWTAAAFIQFSYAEEKEKALFICIQWMLKSLGSAVGAMIAFGANYHQTKATGVSTPVYAVFVVIQCSSVLLSVFLLVAPEKVIRNDGTHIAIFKPPTVVAELKNMGKAFVDRKILILFPAMLVSEMPLALISTLNAFYFNLRTRSLNNLCFQLAQVVVPGIMILILDSAHIPNRRHRGALGLGVMGTVTVGTCAGLYGWLQAVGYSHLTTSPGVDWSDGSFAGGFILYLLFGAVYSGFQMTVEWILSALTNDPAVLAQYAGMIKGTSSLGMCISFIIASQTVPIVWQLTLQFILYCLGIVGMAVVLVFYVKESNYFLEDNVIVPHHVEEEATIVGRITQEQLEAELEKERIAKVQAGDEEMESK